MKLFFYPRLALDGIRKNKRLYSPYLITAAAMVMMYYVTSFLEYSQAIACQPGGNVIAGMLQMGSWIMALFAALFLLYSNSFLMRRRKREFGLYNILGMDKKSIAGILFWEGLFAAAISLAVGLFAGVALSKLFELGLLRMMDSDVDFAFHIAWKSAGEAAMIFGAIFAGLYLNGVRQTSLDSPLALLHSESVGEKPPKANYLVALLGLALLAWAYYLAVTIQDPVSALVVFFLAVGMVILATYLLFIAGSVTLCRILQKNRAYYYRPNHFISVSSMTFRMKRNGAGLASICILLTMVLVTLSSTVSLYVGAEDNLHSRYPQQLLTKTRFIQENALTDGTVDTLRSRLRAFCEENGVEKTFVMDYRTAEISGLLRDGVFQADISEDPVLSDAQIVLALFVDLADYNRIYGQEKTLSPDEVFIYASKMDYRADTFRLEGGTAYRVKEQLTDHWDNPDAAMNIVPALFVVTADLERIVEPITSLKYSGSGKPLLACRWYYGFDTGLEPEEQLKLYDKLSSFAQSLESDAPDVIDYMRTESREANRGEFYGLYGGLLFLGLMLSAVFLAACVLILYYKQITEGYEDQSRFDTMVKVGMTRRDIRRTVNSQMFTVCFLPLLMAGVHMCFAFPLIRKLLYLFNLQNTLLLIVVTAVCFGVFGALYALVYRLTSRAYCSIVSP